MVAADTFDMEIERRRARRISAALSQEKVVRIANGDRTISAELMNLSGVGALIDMDAAEAGAMCLGDCLSLLFQRGGHPFKIPAKPIRKEGRLVAFDFYGLTPESETELKMKVALMEILASRLEPVSHGLNRFNG